MNRETRLTVPFKDKAVRDLRIGDLVYISGHVFTGMNQFHIRAIEENILPPLDFKTMNVLIHMGPVMELVNREWRPVNMAPAASMPFDKHGATLIRKIGLKGIIGKTTMGSESMAAMKEVGCVHLTAVGVMGNTLASQVKRVLDVHFSDELGKTEATWVMELEDAGPFIVSIDTHGKNLFQRVNRIVQKRCKDFWAQYGISKGFTYTNVNSRK